LAAEGQITESREWPGIEYALRHLGRLNEIDSSTLLDWENNCIFKGEAALDDLYKLAGK
jgi:hypothetical protein